MRKIVVDTNVLVRALLKPDSSDGKIIRLVVEGKVALYYSQVLLDELIEVFQYPRFRKFSITLHDVEIFVHTIITYGQLIHGVKKVFICRDPDDNELLAVALAKRITHPVYVISADKDLLVLQDKIEGVEIVTPQRFLRVFQM